MEFSGGTGSLPTLVTPTIVPGYSLRAVFAAGRSISPLCTRSRAGSRMNGNALAYFNLGQLYENGLGVGIDYVQAFTLYSISADLGYSRSLEAQEKLSKRMTQEQITEAQKKLNETDMGH